MPSFFQELQNEENASLGRLKSASGIQEPEITHSGSFAQELQNLESSNSSSLNSLKSQSSLPAPSPAPTERLLTPMEDRNRFLQQERDRVERQNAERVRGRAYLERQLPPGGKIQSTNPEAPFKNQFKMARLDSQEDIANYLRDPENKAIPEHATGGIIKTIKGGFIPGYTLPDDPNFYPVNMPGISKGDVGYIAGKVFNLENLLSVGSQFIPLGRVARLATDVGSSVLGRLGDETIDTATGDQTSKGLGGKLAESGAWGAASSLVSQGVEGVANKLRGVNMTANSTPEELAARQKLETASKELEAGNLNLGQLDASDLWRRVNTVQKIIDPKAAKKETERRAATLKAFQKQISDDVTSGNIPLDRDGNIDYKFFFQNVDDKTLSKIATNYQDTVNHQLRRDLMRGGVQGGVTQEEGGKAVLDAFYAPGGYKDIKGQEVSRAYDNAKQASIDSKAMYRLQDISAEVQKLSEKPVLIKDPKKEGKASGFKSFAVITDPEVKSYLNMLKNVSEDQSTYLVKAQKNKQKVLKTKVRDPGEVMDDLIKVRSRLGDIYEKQVQDGMVDASGRAASTLYGVFSRALEKPASFVGENPGLLWKKANAMHKEKMDTISSFRFGELAKEGALGRGEQAYQTIKPDNLTLEHMTTLQKIMPETEFDKYRQAYYEDVLKDPVLLSSRLDALSQAENALWKKSDKDLVKLYAKKMDKVNQETLVKRLNTLEDDTDRVKNLIGNLSSREAMNILDEVKIPKSVYRMHVMADLIQKTTKMDKGIVKINPSKLLNEVNKLKESGHYKNLTETQRSLIDNAEILNSFLKNTNDVSTALNAGSIQAKSVEFQKPIAMASARLEKRTYAILGWLSERPYLVNKAIRPVPYKSMPFLRSTISLGMDSITALEREAATKKLPEFEQK